jgi:hypothetical protein
MLQWSNQPTWYVGYVEVTMISNSVIVGLGLSLAGAVVACSGPPDGAEAADGAEPAAETSAALVLDAPIYDGRRSWFSPPKPTVCTVGGVQMHCCPEGYAMIGVRLDNNVFKCDLLENPPWSSSSVFLDTSTVYTQDGVSMHTCPNDAVMVGLHRDWNLLACQWHNGEDGWFFGFKLDTGTKDAVGMHVCPPHGVMQGIHADRDAYICTFKLEDFFGSR